MNHLLTERFTPPQHSRRIAYTRAAKAGKLSPYHATLEPALKADAHRAKKNRHAAKALFAQIKRDGYTGCYCQVTAFIRAWRGREG